MELAPAAPVTAALRFTKTWRPAQQRVLDAADGHLADRRVHVVAAPGSGKTVLGLELFRRLGKPALVLSPTTAIRDQWLSRLADFLPPGAPTPTWAGTDLSAPGFLTSVTYQALHVGLRSAGGSGEEGGEEDAGGEAEGEDERAGAEAAPTAAELAEVVRRLRDAGVGTLVLDEAHHLRQAWWKALTKLAAALPDVTVLSLTATPPYDVTDREWRRYEELCGPIDEEIAAPELVRAGTLCPHQDFVWAVEVSGEAAGRLRTHDERVERLVADLLADDRLLAAVIAHPWMATEAPDAEAVLDDPELAFALLVYARARAAQGGGAALLTLLGAEPESVPPPSPRWWQVLLDAYLHGDSWTPDGGERLAHRDALAKRLRAERLLHRRALRLARPGPVETELSSSPAKIDACLHVHALEAAARGADLRQVFLADFIRDDDLSAGAAPRLGAWPVFRALALAADAATLPAMALLTGRLAVVHERVLPRLRALAGARVLAEAPAPVDGLPPGFVRLAAAGSALVAPVTRLLEEGEVRVLVGTRALLGEGWDAPPVNSLVLVSYAGSFVLTNQMRGRAIRRDAARPDKVASIWHVVAVAAATRSGWHDLEELAHRFEVFVGVGATEPVLESGIDRLRLPRPRASGWAAEVNAGSAQRLEAVAGVRELWARSIGNASLGRVLPAVKVTKPPRTRRLLFGGTLRHLLAATGAAFGGGYALVARNASPRDWESLFLVLAIGFGVGLVFALPGLVRAAVLLARHLPVDGSVRQIAAALHEALVEAGHVRPGTGADAVRVSEVAPGEYAVSFAGASFRESAVFADCLDELLGPIENPRYLLTRPGAGAWFRGRVDHHAVPELLGARKETAALLHEAWRRRVGGGELVYTRTAEGRRVLLGARARAFSTAAATATRRLDRWQ